jgi:hypothetical protein
VEDTNRPAVPDRPHHVPPREGVDQPLHGTRQGGGGAGYVTVNNRLFAPLQGLAANNVLQGGYGWLSITDNGATFHPGLDLNSGGSCNADEGAGVVAPLGGVVRALFHWNGSSYGEGNHVWVELDDPCCPGPTFWHTDHLLDILVSVGQRVVPGQPIGLCGRTGGWDCAHAHTELAKSAPQDGWWQWPYGWSRAQVEAAYWNPTQWWQAATALVLAEAEQPIPPEVVMAMSDWELTNYVLKQLYDWAGIAFNPDGGMAKTWVAAMRAGHYPGRPRTDDRRYGEGEGDGWWAEFESGLLVYKRDGTMSWTG